MHPTELGALCALQVTVHERLDGVEHMVIGAHSERSDRSGVRDCAKLRSFILDGCRHALSDSLAHARARQSPLPLRGSMRGSSFANLQSLQHLAG